MKPRVFAAILCAIAARRWPRLGFVSAALAIEHITPELIERTHSSAPIVWASSSSIVAGVGSSFGTSPRQTALIVVIVCLLIAACMPSETCQVAFACAVSMLFCMLNLMRVRTTNPEQTIVTMLLAGNVATSALTLAIGVDVAYSSDVVRTSNAITHLVVVGLVLWASHPR